MEKFLKNQQIPLTQVIDPSTGQIYYSPQNVVYDDKTGAGPTYLRDVIVDQAVSSSYFSGSITNAISASYALTASYVAGLPTSSISSSYALSASYAVTASYANYAETASSALNAQDILVYVKNQSGNAIAKGVVVRITGSNNSSDIPRIVTASYINDNNSANTLGITNQSIANGSEGYVVTEGILKGIDTNAFTSGQLIYLGATGSIIGYAPVAPLHAVRLGEVVRHQSNNGSIYVRIDNGYELSELHDVLITSASSGDLLIRSASVWINSRQLTGSYAITGSLNTTTLTASNATISGNVTVLGTASINTLIVNQIGYSSGSNQLGDAVNDTQTLYGNVIIPTGSLIVSGTLAVTSSAIIQTLTVGLGVGRVASNTALGYQALNANTTGASNVAIGYQSGLLMSTGANNSSLGYFSLRLNTTGSGNTALGNYAMSANVGGNNSTGVGSFALQNTTGNNNTGVGNQSLVTNTSGINNTALGQGSLYYNTTASNNTAVGYRALQTNTIGADNTSMGVDSLLLNSTGSSNVAIGKESLRSTTTSTNTAIGYQAGYNNTSGANNIFIGANSTGASATDSNRTWIGNSSTTSTWLAGNVLIGTTTDAGSKLLVRGSGTTSATTSLLVQNANASASLSITDDSTLYFKGASNTSLRIKSAIESNSSVIQFNNDGLGGGYSGGYTFTNGNNGSYGSGVSLRIYPGKVAIGNVTEPTIQNNATNLYVDNTQTGGRNKAIKLNVNFANFSTEYNGINFDTIENGAGGAFIGSQHNPLTNGYDGDLAIFCTAGSSNSYNEIARFVGKRKSLSLGAGRNPSASLHISGASDFALLKIDSPAVNNILYVSGSGNVGIGTGTPTTTLDVSGSGRFTNNLTVTGSFTVTTGSSIEFQVNQTGVKIGNAPTDSHSVTGSFSISSSAGTGSAIYAYKSGSTVLDIQGSQGQLFSVTDALSGSLMSVNDVSGLPILEVFSDDRVVMGTYGAPALTVTGSTLIATGSLLGTASYATTALSASYAPVTPTFPYTGSALITGSLTVIGDTVMTGSLTVSGSSTFTNIGPAIFSGSINLSNSSFNPINLNYNTLYFTPTTYIGYNAPGLQAYTPTSYVWQAGNSYASATSTGFTFSTGSLVTPSKFLYLYDGINSDTTIKIENNNIFGSTTAELGTSKSTGTVSLYATSNDALRFGTNNSERMRIFAGGNVAIGIPVDTGYKLNVVGTTRIQGSFTATGGITGSLLGTASYATTALSASYAIDYATIASTYICNGYLVTNQSFATGSDAIIQFDRYDDPNGWLSSNRFTPTIAGYYHIDFGVWLNNPGSTTNQVNVQMRKNGVTHVIIQQPLNNSVGQSLAGSKIIYLNGSTDQIDFTVFQAVGSSPTGTILQGTADGSGTWFSAFLLTK